MTPVPVSENDLHGYVDGQLDGERRRDVEAYLLEHPDEAQQVREFSAQNRSMHALFDDVLNEPIPLGMAARQPPGWSAWAMRTAATILVFIVGAGAGWFGHATYRSDSEARLGIASRALVAHAVYSPEVRHPVEVEAKEEAHLVAWLSKRVGAPLRAPVLTEVGYRLVGGRLLPGSNSPAAQFMYENAAGNRITLYARSRSGEEPKTAFRYFYQGDIGVFYWIDDPLGYAVAGQLNREELLKVARLVYAQFEQ